jgi:hypothetical protein
MSVTNAHLSESRYGAAAVAMIFFSNRGYMSDNTQINTAFIGIARRAETVETGILVDTFVNVGPLLTVLSSRNHQIVFGRRGTGKTHALIYMLEKKRAKGHIGVFIDLRTIGSSGGLYGDVGIPLPERGTRLLLDVLADFHRNILQACLDGHLDLSLFAPVLDSLATASTQVVIVGEVSREVKEQLENSRATTSKAEANISKSPSFIVGGETRADSKTSSEQSYSEHGERKYRVHFGGVSNALADLISALAGKEVVLVLDEWSTVPFDLQPYLADLIRRAFFPVRGITVKIAAIEQRAQFKTGEANDYTGIEIGADASADVNLDDYLVFENDQSRTVQFFHELLFSHYKSSEEDHPHFNSANSLIKAAFTQTIAFEDFVRAAEGVPRDAFNVLSLAAQKAITVKISIQHVRVAARNWYQRDKEASVRSSTEAQDLLNWIIDRVIGEKKARAFLLRSNTRHPLIDTLFDARLLHIAKKSISSKDEPGVRYDAYKLDFGAYVDLLTTKAAPARFFMADDEAAALVDVPMDDYRAIRTAILDLNEFSDRSKS